MAEGEVSSGSWSASAAKIDSPFEFEEQRVQFVRGWVTFETRFLGGPRAKVRHGHAMLGFLYVAALSLQAVVARCMVEVPASLLPALISD